MRPPALLCLHDDVEWLAPSLRSFIDVELIACISRQSWNGMPGDWQKAVAICEAEGVEAFLGHWTSEEEHNQAGLVVLLNRRSQSDYVVQPT